MSPEVMNEVFLTKSTQCMCIENNTGSILFQRMRYVAASVVTDTHRTTTVTLAHAPRDNEVWG